MRKTALAFSALAVIWSTSAFAAVHELVWAGAVREVEGDSSRPDIQGGEPILASFSLDDASAAGPVVLALGGGFYSVYSVPVYAFTLSVGSYTITIPDLTATLTYIDNSFGADGIVVTMDGLTGGPFGSTFADVQFQARGPLNAIDDTGIGNGLPYGRFAPSFFAVFGDGSSAERVFGDLTISDNAVPEPATWIELLIGFGAMGSHIRRRLALIARRRGAGVLSRSRPLRHETQPKSSD